MKLSFELKVTLFRLGISQAELAQRIESTPARVSRIIRGHVRPGARERARIARVLRVPSWQLFPNTGRGKLKARLAGRKRAEVDR